MVQTKFDARTLHEQPAVAAESRMVDDGKGAKEVFRVDNFDLLQVAEEDHGRFYSGDCYVVLYAYNNGARDQVGEEIICVCLKPNAHCSPN